ncbi:hypothetical protein CRYUN_Cryun03dG0023700 [Craigia yunnanensis]
MNALSFDLKRRLLQATAVTPDVTVVADGNGDFRMVSEAAAPERSTRRYIIKIKDGVYRENVDVPRRKTNLITRLDHQSTKQWRCVGSDYRPSTGTVDFIFGNAAAVFQNCGIHARRPNPGQRNMVTAQGHDYANHNTGIVIQKCRIGATSDLLAVKGNFSSYIGRPWKLYSRTVIMQSVISDIIQPAGWVEWDRDFALDTLTYREYQNTGPGAGTSKRVTW